MSGDYHRSVSILEFQTEFALLIEAYGNTDDMATSLQVHPPLDTQMVELCEEVPASGCVGGYVA